MVEEEKMKKCPMFSIITVCYNSETTIERTIESVLAQTYINYEYIIVDGMSKDRTLDIVRVYEPKFNGKLKVISECDNGIYDAMNKGIRNTTGNIIGIVNSDDWLEEDALITILNCCKSNNYSFNSLYCGWINFHYLNGDNQIMKTSHQMLKNWSSKYEMAGIRHPAVFVPKKLYDEYGIFDDRMKVMADTDIILRFYFKGIQFCYPEKVISNMSDGGVSNKHLLKAYNDYRLILQKYEVSKGKSYYLLCIWKLKRILKSFIPTKLLYLYRNFSKA